MISFKQFFEEFTFKVDVEGLPDMFMKGNSPGSVKAHLRKLVKQPSMIKSVDRMTKHDVKKTYRAKSQGKEVDEMTQQSKELPNLKIAVGTSAQKAKAAAERSAKRKNNRKGTHLAAQKEATDISELSPATVKSYKKKASDSNYKAASRFARVAASPTSRKYKNKEMGKQDDIMRKRKAGLAMADKKESSSGDVDYGSDQSIKIMKKKTPGQTENYVVHQYKNNKKTGVMKRFKDLKKATAHANKQDGDHRVHNEDMNELSHDTMNKYNRAAQRSKDKATNSAVATILRKGDHSKDLQTRNKRMKGMALAKSRTLKKVRGDK